MQFNNFEKCNESCCFVPYCEGVETCQKCGLGKTLLAGRVPELQDYIARDDQNQADKTARPLHLYARYLREAGPGWLLDIGCGEGTLLDIAAVTGWRVAGVDTYAAQDRKHAIVTARFLDHEFGDSFDAVTLIHSFEHMADPYATLCKCRALLRPHGRLLIVVPNFGGWWAQITGKHWDWLNVADHRYHYTRQALAKLTEQAGFRIEVCRTYSAFAPSMPEIYLSVKRVFDWPAVRWRPIRGGLYRLSRLAGVVCNPIVDLIGQGAELEVLARPI